MVQTRGLSMRIAIYIVSALLFLAGFIWFLQGLNVLLGSFMSGQPEWAVYGAIAMITATVLVLWNRRRR